jgi:hypothetical protein
VRRAGVREFGSAGVCQAERLFFLPSQRLNSSSGVAMSSRRSG